MEKYNRRRKMGRAMEMRGLFWKIFAMILLSFGKRQEKGTEGTKAENLGNDRIFLDLNNRDLSGCFGKFLQ